jgi:hypothetical protein
MFVVLVIMGSASTLKGKQNHIIGLGKVQGYVQPILASPDEFIREHCLSGKAETYHQISGTRRFVVGCYDKQKRLFRFFHDKKEDNFL